MSAVSVDKHSSVHTVKPYITEFFLSVTNIFTNIFLYLCVQEISQKLANAAKKNLNVPALWAQKTDA